MKHELCVVRYPPTQIGWILFVLEGVVHKTLYNLLVKIHFNKSMPLMSNRQNVAIEMSILYFFCSCV
jgi:hypothetical protein